ncbi:F-box/kelch-repeat protein At3g06240-like [Rutidosis leptorrhynchoides]|uniref:F-box/kelch-repeat protein At3g06240-like n=1 Tax=Rutidosis leptorrhynchoides TaxID=125765 RepID=UPI003A9A27A2
MSNPISALNHLPSDLIEAILSFLPPKSLGRFKLFSKRWCSLISSPNFIKTHIRNYTTNNPNPNPSQLILVPYQGYYLYSLDIKQLNSQTTPPTVFVKCLNFEEPCFQILGSCNGLLLVSDLLDNLYLLNPTTQKSLKVLEGESNDTTTYGFGYDSSKDDYKIISIFYKAKLDSDLDSSSVHVYSLRNNSWNKLSSFPYLLRDPYIFPGVLINNNLHWVVTRRCSTLM